MKKRAYVHADSYGMVYRFTSRKWKAMLEAVAAGGEADYDDYGKPLLVLDHRITDLNQERAQDLLADLAEEAARAAH